MKKFLVGLSIFTAGTLYGMDTYVFRVDPDAFPVRTLTEFTEKGKRTDREPFRQTYMVQNSTRTDDYYTLKITPKDEAELALLLSFVGRGLEILGVYDLSGGIFKTQQENSATVRISKDRDAGSGVGAIKGGPQ